MAADLMSPDTWEGQASATIRRAAADYRRWAEAEDSNGLHQLATDLRRMAERLDRIYPEEATP